MERNAWTGVVRFTKEGGYAMVRFSIALALAGLALLAVTGIARAAVEGTIELTAVAEVEVEVLREDGETDLERVKAATVVPGDEVIYTIYYTNVGDKSADRVVVTNPLPEEMLYVDGSAAGEGAAVTFSVDGGKTYAAAVKLTVLDADGNERSATAEDYTHIRWKLENPVASGEGGHVDFRARLA